MNGVAILTRRIFSGAVLKRLDSAYCRAEDYFRKDRFGTWLPASFQFASSLLLLSGGGLLGANALWQPDRFQMIRESLGGNKREGFAPENQTQEASWWLIRAGFIANIASLSTVGFKLGNPVITLCNFSMGLLSFGMHQEIPYSLWAVALGLVLPAWAYTFSDQEVGSGKRPRPLPPHVASLRKRDVPSAGRRLFGILGQNFREGSKTLLHPRRLFNLRSPYHGFYVMTAALMTLVPGGLGIVATRLWEEVGGEKNVATDSLYWFSKQVFKAGCFFDAVGMFFLGRNLRHPLKMVGGALIALGTPFMDSPVGRGFHAFGTGSVFLSFARQALPGRIK